MRSTIPAALAAVASLFVAWNGGAALEGLRPVHPRGTFVRPADGVRDPSLDRAWDDYKAAIQSASAAVRAVMEERKAAAKEKGSLEGVDGVEAQLKTWDEQGILPSEESMRPAVNRAAKAIREANSKLLNAYDDAVRAFTKGNREVDARAAKDERGALDVGLGFPPIPNVPERLFDGRIWDDWGQGWGGEHRIFANDEAIRLLGFQCFAHERVLTRAYTLELEVRNRTWEKPNSAVQFGIQEIDGCMVRIPARNQAGALVPGKAEVIHYNDETKQTNSLVIFDCPLPVGNKWHKCQFSWGGGRYSVVIDGKKVVDNQPLPFPMQRGFNLHVGVGDGAADFKNLELTEDVSPP